MTTLVEWLMSGGGLEGASPRQVKAILEKLDTLAVVVENRSLPKAVFGVTENGGPFVAYLNTGGAPNRTAEFSREHLSAGRALRAVREAMAVHAAVTTTDSYGAASYSAAREVYVRQLLEVRSVADGGAPSLAEGVL